MGGRLSQAGILVSADVGNGLRLNTSVEPDFQGLNFPVVSLLAGYNQGQIRQ